MNTEQIVKRLIELVNEGKNIQAEEELYSQDIISVEQDGHTVKGLSAVIEKTKAAIDNIQESHGGGVTEAFVGKDSFLITFSMDFTAKDGSRIQMKDHGFYKVNDGKISEEYFFVQPLA